MIVFVIQNPNRIAASTSGRGRIGAFPLSSAPPIGCLRGVNLVPICADRAGFDGYTGS